MKIFSTPKQLYKRGASLLVILAVGVIGYSHLSSGSALTAYAGAEPETGSITAPAIVGSDTTASGGKYVKFGVISSCPAGIGHRGYWGTATGYTENSLNALKAVYTTGLSWSETDVHYTSDGVPVLMHDDTVDRTTNGTGTISSMTLAQFQALRLNDGSVPPTLAQAISLVRDTPGRKMFVEVKDPLSSSQRQTLLQALAGLESQLYLIGFSETVPTLQALKTANPVLNVSVLARDATTTVPTGFSGKNSQYTYITKDAVSALHANGYTVRSWTPDALSEWRTLKAAGVDGIITDKTGDYVKWMAGGCQ